ncbi:uncharacterized protein IL334_001137 [Kwoniella shivajii]|uniref:ESCRT-I complex subunit TSG101 n=1 Tax=Kwoniella shivajii TaxID=564305 RepID=A0ABZ1CR37_9TREE|nr:hypothetical protein IL334_001137 [Kwoniella shivajii]
MSHLDLTREWLGNVLRRYPAKDRIINEVIKILSERKTLSVKTDAFTFNSGQTALLLLLHGTLPINYRGSTYHIPIHLWVPHDYPKSAPMAFVTPTKEMGIRKSREVDPSGRVREEILDEWWRSYQTQEIDHIINQLISIFSITPPVYAKPPESSSPAPAHLSRNQISSPIQSRPQPSSQPQQHYNVQATQSQPPPPPARPAFGPPPTQEILPQYRPAPTPPPHPFSQGSGSGSHSRQSSSTYPISNTPPPGLQSQTPHSPSIPNRPGRTPQPQSPISSSGGPTIPQRPYIPQSPHQPLHQHSTGFPQLPITLPRNDQPHQYINGYQPVFPQESAQGYPPQTNGQYPPSQQPYRNQQLPSVNPTSPHFIAQHPNSQQSQMQSQQYHNPPQPQQQPRQPQPQPQPQRPIQAGPPVARQPVDLLSSPEPSSLPLPSSDAPPPIPPSKPPPPSLQHLHSILLPHLQASLPPLIHSLQATRTHLLERREDLVSGEPAIRDEMARLEAVKKVCDSTGRKLGDVVKAGEDRVAELEGKGEVSVDELICGISIVHNQLIDLVAEDNAIEDTIYHMTRALDAERVDLDRYLKSIRSLAREQYMKRALIERILQGMGQTERW